MTMTQSLGAVLRDGTVGLRVSRVAGAFVDMYQVSVMLSAAVPPRSPPMKRSKNHRRNCPRT